MKGITTSFANDVVQESAIVSTIQTQSLDQSVRNSLQDYFLKLGGQTPSNLYDLVLAQVERPLIEMVLQHTSNNQSKTAKILGISRGTLRKKMAQYDLFEK